MRFPQPSGLRNARAPERAEEPEHEEGHREDHEGVGEERRGVGVHRADQQKRSDGGEDEDRPHELQRGPAAARDTAASSWAAAARSTTGAGGSTNITAPTQSCHVSPAMRRAKYTKIAVRTAIEAESLKRPRQRHVRGCS